VLLLVLVAMLARTWRLFFLVQLPLLLLSAAFAIFTLSYGTPPGEFLAHVLATSTWEAHSSRASNPRRRLEGQPRAGGRLVTCRCRASFR
jgi:hypothetical protein